MTSESVGFVGSGLMGHGIAANILRGGYSLGVIAHRSRAQIEDLVERGAMEAGSLAELGERSSLVFLCVPGSPQVEASVAGLSEGLKPGSVIVDCSTSDPVSTQALSQRLAERGIDLADAPLGGTPVQAEEGKLSAMVGASDAVFARIRPVIETWAATIRHIGGPGAGHRMKLINNFFSLGYAAVYAEALALAAKVGLSPQTVDSVIRGSRMDCGFYQTFMGYIIDGDRDAHKFTLVNALKDLTYLESMANAARIANPLGNAAKNSFSAAVAAGGTGAEDYVPHLVRFVGERNGVRLEP